MAAAYADIGKGAKEVLSGSREGVFQFDQKLTASSKTADGVALTLTAINKGGEKVDLALRSAYAYKNYSLSAVFNATDKVAVTAAVDKIAPGLKATLSATLPDSSSAKLAADYVNPYVNLKTTVGLTSQPKVSVAAASFVKNVLFGAEATFDTAKSALSGYSAGLGYHAGDSQFALTLVDKFETLKVAVSHNVSRDSALGAEFSRPVSGGDVAFTLGLARRLANGALVKAKVDNKGLASALYEQKLASGEKIVLSSQLDTLNLNGKPPKVGLAFDLA